MNIFDHSIKEDIYNKLIEWGVSEGAATILDGIIILVYLALLVIIINLVLRWGVVRGLHWLVHRTRATWDDILFDSNVMQRLTGIVTPVVVKMMLPLAIAGLEISDTWIEEVLFKCVDILIVIACLRFVNRLLKTLYELMLRRPAWHDKPIKGLLETMQVILAIVGVILIVAIIIDKSPAGLLTGLGASAAVLSFIFKDSLMGLVAGVQLSANNMLKVGDWISLPKRGVDGEVEEVSLTTIKVRAWDKTLQMLPPYLLISEPFDNWQAMRSAGGRRIKRSLNVDMTTIMLADSAFIDTLRQSDISRNLIEPIQTQSAEGGTLTNLDLFMRAVNNYLLHHPRVNPNMTVMVRQLQPSQWGLPIEIYCFSADVNWVPYENLQTEIISYVVAVAPLFGLRMYQAPSSADLRN